MLVLYVGAASLRESRMYATKYGFKEENPGFIASVIKWISPVFQNKKIGKLQLADKINEIIAKDIG